MGKQPKIHTIYTFQVKASGTRQFGQDQLDDMMESIAETAKGWFPKGEVSFARHDMTESEKRVVITDVIATRQRPRIEKTQA